MNIFLALVLLQSPAGAEENFSSPGMTTYETNRCASTEIAVADERLDRYVEAAHERLAERDDPQILERFERSQAAWGSTPMKNAVRFIDTGQLEPFVA